MLTINANAEYKDEEARVTYLVSGFRLWNEHREAHQMVHYHDELKLVEYVHILVISRVTGFQIACSDD